MMTRAGEYIDAFCPRCSLLLAHIVLFELDGKVSRVQCRTCRMEHKYKGGKPEAKRKSIISKYSSPSSVKKASRSVNMMDLQRWQDKKASLSPEKEAREYNLDELFHKGDVIRHVVFGLGFVEKVVFDRQVDVLFEGGVKRLAMNMKRET